VIVQIMSRDNPYLGRAMAQAVIRLPLAAKDRVRVRFSPRGTSSGQVALGQVFTQVARFTPSTSSTPST
jgi:hypothetical protein